MLLNQWKPGGARMKAGHRFKKLPPGEGMMCLLSWRRQAGMLRASNLEQISVNYLKLFLRLSKLKNSPFLCSSTSARPPLHEPLALLL